MSRVGRTASFFAAFATFTGLVGCETDAASPSPEVEVGVFFGGQIQRVTSLEVSTVAPPRFGFRVKFPPVRQKGEVDSRTVSYEIVKPGPAGRRVTEEGELSLTAEQLQLDHVVELPEDAKMGVWNVRVTWKESILADRSIYLVRPQ